MSVSVKKAALFDKNEKGNPDHWYIDSCASQHFSPYKDLFETMTAFEEACEIETAEGISYGTGTGSIIIAIIGENGLHEVELQNVMYAPNMEANLLSAVALYDLGYEISMKPGRGMNIIKDDIIIGKTVRHGKIFRLQTLSNFTAYSAVTVKPEPLDVWHRRMGHLGRHKVLELPKLATGIAIEKNYEIGVCEPCQKGKQTRQPSHKPAKRAKRPGELVHSDLCGKIEPPSVGGHNYAGTFTDDATRMTSIYPLETKTAAELLENFKKYKTEVESMYKIRRLRTDGGGEYKNVFGDYLKEEGIKHEMTAPYTPEQNGVSERVNRTVIGRTKAILADTKLPKELWMEIASTVVYLKNRSPTSALKKITPYEAWYKEKPDLSHLRIIGTTAYVHIPKELRKKLDFNAKIGMLVGYDGRNQYRMWDPIRKDVIVSRDVDFDEEKIPKSITQIAEEQM